jgi:type I restriction enzyme S subunit
MVYNEELKREIPANWTVKKLKDLFEFDKGTEVGSSAYSEVQKKGFVRFYRVGDIDGNSTTFVGNESTLNIAKPSDVVVTFDGSVGKLGLGLDGAISGGLRKIYDKSGEIDNSFVWLLFLDSHTKTTIEKYATGSVLLHAGSSINHLNMPFNKEVVLRFQEVVKPIFEQYISNKQEVVSLAQLRDYLLPMLMNGQVVVKD